MLGKCKVCNGTREIRVLVVGLSDWYPQIVPCPACQPEPDRQSVIIIEGLPRELVKELNARQ